MNIFDIVIAVILIIAFIRGFMKGFFVEIASLIALIGGIYGAIHFSYFAANILKKYVAWSENYIVVNCICSYFYSHCNCGVFFRKGLHKNGRLCSAWIY